MSLLGTHGRARELAARAAVEDAEHHAHATGPQAESHARLQVLIESRAIWSLLLGAVIGLLVGFVVFPGERPALAGNDDMSIQFYGAVVGGVTAGMAFIVGWSLNTRMANIWMGQRPALQQVIDTLSLVVMHSSIAVMASLGIFRVFQEAFIGLTVDHIAGSVLLGLVGAVSGYFAFNSGARLTAFSLSTILAIFMASGILISTLFAENPYWWHVMFSELGTGQAGTTSFWTFNTTLVVSGIIITTLTGFISRDLRLWAEAARIKVGRRIAQRQQRAEEGSRAAAVTARVSNSLDAHFWNPRIGVVRACMVGMGVSLAGIGLIPISLHHDGHVVASAGFALFFLILLVGIPYWLPGFPRSFYLFSYVAAGALIFSFVLWIPMDYWNLTSMELVGAAILFSWLVVFIRNIAAQVERVRAVG
ncbi:hypothetical protein [Nesterenkonia sp. NBAIMH1]|uniref:hypothetical protein n=1 Tax=Nesterenkonia sp. NBAIMH1 TaxID=2600320 RepID=UPI00143E0118|nr:hypothetical protein [Nesterenkonia sp. NBAIMH1]